MKNKQRSKKGLTDQELAAKYEAGKINLSKIIKPALEGPDNPFKSKPKKSK